MTEDEFWQLVASLRGQVAEVAFDGLTERLASGPVERILAFGEQLDGVLRRLDQIALWSQKVWDTEDDQMADPPPLDAEGFLDARAAVVCAGRARYQAVLADPDEFGGVWDFAAEMLLYVPVEAYEKAVGEPWPRFLPGTDKPVSDPDGKAAADAPVSPVAVTPAAGPEPASDVDDDTGTIRLDVSAEAYRLVDIVATYAVEPLEGFLAEPSPRTELSSDVGIGPWPDHVTGSAFGFAATKVSEVIRRHGGLAALRLSRLWVVLVLAQRWDLTLLLRPFSGAVHVCSKAVSEWTPARAERAVTALAAHVVIEVAKDYQVDLPAVEELVRLRDAGADLIPFSATTD